jgi:hypothetical protein
MKTAVSIPDDLFRKAEAAARRLRVSRSQLYAKAIAELLSRQQREAITDWLNSVYGFRVARALFSGHFGVGAAQLALSKAYAGAPPVRA